MFQLHVSIYVSIISFDSKRIILFHNYKLVSRISFTSGLLKFYQCFRKNNYWVGILGAIYIYQIKFPLDRTITRRKIKTNTHFTCPCIYTFICIIFLYILLVFYFGYIKRSLSSLVTQRYKLQMLFSDQLSEFHSFLKTTIVFLMNNRFR